MKGQTWIILAFIFALIVAIFAVINVEAVNVDFLFWSGDVPLILIILSSVLMGGIITGAFGIVKLFKLQRQVRSLKQENTALKQEKVKADDHQDQQKLAETDANGETSDNLIDEEDVKQKAENEEVQNKEK